jgi:hypothetical protein
MQSGTSRIEKGIRELIIEQFLHFNIDEVCLVPKDIMTLLKNETGMFSNTPEIADILKKWGYEPEKGSKYYKRWRYMENNDGIQRPGYYGATGRFYTFKKEDFVAK